MNAPDTTTSEPAPSAWADGYREAIRDALTVCREIRDVVSDGAPGQPSNAAAACCGAVARIVTPPPRTQAETDVLAEHRKQRAKWGNDYDDEHVFGLLALAAASLACDGTDGRVDHPDGEKGENFDPWGLVAKHGYRATASNGRKVAENRRHALTVAAALLLAEIERLDRAGGE